MDRRKFLAWSGVSWIASSLSAAINFLSFEHASSAQDLVQTLRRSRQRRRTTFYTQGRHLFDRQGNKVMLRGVNKMSVWDDKDPTGKIYLPEIRKTGANTVRIVWAIRKDLKPGNTNTDLTRLEAVIANAKANRLIPMVDLHDAMGKWERLPELVTYWTQPTVLNIIKKHQAYLLINIGGEVGDYQVSEADFIKGYTRAIQQMRAAGINTPLVIDATDWGKKLDMLDATAKKLIAVDPNKNLLFSIHPYWPIAKGADAKFIRSKLQKSASLGYPLIVGEFSAFGGYVENNSGCPPEGRIDYKAIMKECQRLKIGWYAWEWGPGNQYGGPGCAILDMTSDGLFKNLQPGWPKEVAITSPYSIKNTSITPPKL